MELRGVDAYPQHLSHRVLYADTTDLKQSLALSLLYRKMKSIISGNYNIIRSYPKTHLPVSIPTGVRQLRIGFLSITTTLSQAYLR